MDTRSNFHQSLDELQADLLNMGKKVEDLIHNAVQSLVKMDKHLAEEIVASDDLVDDMLLSIEESCLRLIALQQPMATDLRIISTALKISTDLERIADHAVDIAKVTIRLSGQELIKPLVDIPLMAEKAREMLVQSIAAYTERDVDLAASLAQKDDEVDHLYGKIFQEVRGMMGADIEDNRQLIHLLLVAQYLERVADHTTNIGESVIYMVVGKRKDLNV
jgi:phosphate transport system protein